MESWSDEFMTRSASRIAGIDSRKHALLSKCFPTPFLLNTGESGYGDLGNPGDPQKIRLRDDLIYLAQQGYLTWTSEPTGRSRTYSSKNCVFTLTEKGKQFLFLGEPENHVLTVASKASRETSIAHCPSEVESLEHLAGEEVSRDPSKGAYPLCPICYHYHQPVNAGGCHMD